MVGSDAPHDPLIKDIYSRVIYEIMSDRSILPWPRRDGRHVVNINTNFIEAVQHTEAFLTERLNDEPHFRYRRYMRELRRRVEPSMHRVAHIDIGCGAGLFSWVFLDWATENGIDHNHIDLFGLDHCPAMMDLASIIRMKLMQTIPMPNYPSLNYGYDADDFRRRIHFAWRPDTDYIITFGHVLVQSYTQDPSIIQDFVKIIDFIMRFKSLGSRCELIAVDATTGTRPHIFTAGWESLLNNLEQYDIHHRSNDPTSSLYASLTNMDEFP